MESAAAEFNERLQRDVDVVSERRRRCVDETVRVQQERRQFIDDVDKTAATIRQTVSHTAPSAELHLLHFA